VKPLQALRELGTGGEAPLDAKQRVHAALMASLAAATVATTLGSVGAHSSAVLPVAPAPLIGGFTSAKALSIAAGIWLIGGATGAALYGALHAPEVRVVYVDRPAVANSVAAPAASVPPPSAVVPTASAAVATSAFIPPDARVSSKRESRASASPTSDLARERALLDLARESAGHGEPAVVLAQTEQHRTQFPQGKLSEEREALAIRALLALGRAGEARDRARAFQLAHPNSMLLPVIDSALSAP